MSCFVMDVSLLDGREHPRASDAPPRLAAISTAYLSRCCVARNLGTAGRSPPTVTSLHEAECFDPRHDRIERGARGEPQQLGFPDDARYRRSERVIGLDCQ